MISCFALFSLVAPAPITIGVFGDVAKPGLQVLAAATPAEWSKAMKLAEPRADASSYLHVVRATGDLQRVKWTGTAFELASDDPADGKKVEPIKAGDLVYVPQLSEAIVVEKGKAHRVCFEGPSCDLDAVLGSNPTASRESVVIPRFLERFQAPDLVEKPNDLVFPLIGQFEQVSGPATQPPSLNEPLEWIARNDGIVGAGDLVIVKGAEMYAQLASKAQSPERDWIRAWKAAPWSLTSPFAGYNQVPLGSTIIDSGSTKSNMSFALIGPYDFKDGSSDPQRVYAQERKVGEGRPAIVPLTLSNRSKGRLDIERIDKTRVFVFGLNGATVDSVELNRKESRQQYDLADESGDPTLTAAIRQANEKRRGRLRGTRIVHRLFPIAYANFLVDLDKFGDPESMKAQGKSWLYSTAAFAHFEQDNVAFDPNKRLKPTDKALFWTYPGLMKLTKLKNVEGGGTLIKRVSVSATQVEWPMKPNFKPLESGALVLRTGAKS